MGVMRNPQPRRFILVRDLFSAAFPVCLLCAIRRYSASRDRTGGADALGARARRATTGLFFATLGMGFAASGVFLP